MKVVYRRVSKQSAVELPAVAAWEKDWARSGQAEEVDSAGAAAKEVRL